MDLEIFIFFKVPEPCAEVLEDENMACSFRDEIEVKGKGRMRVRTAKYFLYSRKYDGKCFFRCTSLTLTTTTSLWR